MPPPPNPPLPPTPSAPRVVSQGFSHGFPGVFLVFSHSFPGSFPVFSGGFPGVLPGFFRGLPRVFQGFSWGFPKVFLRFSRGIFFLVFRYIYKYILVFFVREQIHQFVFEILSFFYGSNISIPHCCRTLRVTQHLE